MSTSVGRGGQQTQAQTEAGDLSIAGQPEPIGAPTPAVGAQAASHICRSPVFPACRVAANVCGMFVLPGHCPESSPTPCRVGAVTEVPV